MPEGTKTVSEMKASSTMCDSFSDSIQQCHKGPKMCPFQIKTSSTRGNSFLDSVQQCQTASAAGRDREAEGGGEASPRQSL